MTGRITPERAQSMRPPLDGLETRADTLAAIAAQSDVPTAEAGPGSAGRLRLTLGSGEEIDAAALIVATGSTPRTIDVPGHAQWVRAGRLTTLHAVADALAIRSRLAATTGARVLVSGAGLVGSEAATLLSEAGHTVTLVAPSTPPGEAALGRTLASRLAEIHAEAVETRFGARLVRLEDLPDEIPDDAARGLAVLSDGTTLEADFVIIAHGAHPHVPRGVGGETGIPVDDRLRVRGRPGILAAGAVALFTAGDGRTAQGADGRTAYRIDHWDDAEAQGAHAARTLLHDLGLGEDPGAYRPLAPWSARIHGRQLAGFGHRLPGAQERIVSEDPLLVEFVDEAGDACAVLGLDAGRMLRDHGRSLRG
jgi:NADPH-dependent 2,4-dienoyl-CoA reductase/sulfur reductase-like enzyme